MESCDIAAEPTDQDAEDTRPVSGPAALAGTIRSYQRGQSVGRYVVLSELGKGGMSVVYSAFDPELDRKVAIKLLRMREGTAADDDRKSRLLREAQALAKLSHPNVVPVFDVGTIDDRVFIAMELIDGRTLSDWIGEERRSWREIVALFLEAGRGLAAAHAAGLIHRDFKPQNVLVGSDGSVRVMDFGLVQRLGRPAKEDRRPTTISWEVWKAEAGAAHTVAGRVMGTPTYMAPEQMSGDSVDAQADQYAFCVSLYQGLYGVTPFGKGSWQRLQADKDALRLQPTPTAWERRVPRRMRKALLRGLDPDPTRRWPSMNHLLDALERDPGRRLAKATAVMFGIGFAMAGGWAYGQVQERGEALCSGGRARVKNIWDPGTQKVVEDRFAASGLNYAGETWLRVKALLDEQTSNWVAAHRRVCEATHVDGQQSATLLDLRMACLDRQLGDFQATVELFREADANVVRNAVKAISAMEPVHHCERITKLENGPPPPPEKQAQVETLEKRIADSKALSRAGKYPEALEVAVEVLARAVALEHPPLVARAQFTVGRLQYDVGDYETAEHSLREASWLAEAQRQDEISAEAQIVLVATVGDKLRRMDEGLQWGRHAEAMVARIASNDDLEASLWTSMGSTYSSHGLFAKAKQFHKRALDVDYRARGRDHLMVGIHHNNLGTAAARMHDTDEAIASLRRAIEIFERQLGSNHPNVGVALLNFGATLSLASEPEEAKAALERSIVILEGALGQNHPYIAHAAQNLAVALDALGEHERAAELLGRSVAIQEAALGPTHPVVAELMWSLSSALWKADRIDDAGDVVAKLRALAQGAPTAEPLVAGWWLVAEGRLHARRGEHEQAAAHYERGVALMDDNPGFPEDLSVWLLIGLGESLRESGRPAKSRSVLERVIDRAPPPQKKLRARARFELAKSVVADHGDPALARTLAEEALAQYRQAGPGFSADMDTVKQWIDATLLTPGKP